MAKAFHGPTWERIEDLFSQALEQPVELRTQFLEQATNDVALRSEVASMLAAESQPQLAIERLLVEVPESEADLGTPSQTELAPEQTLPTKSIGPYRLVKRVGSGGMGEVFLAERDDAQFSRKVAIKLMGTGSGVGSRDLLRRFDLERQVLAQLQHASIAQLLDAGSLEDGRPYLVMEYVDGEPITAYCDRVCLDVDGRLELFRAVCNVVQFAHSRLVIHRDLKPSNIMVVETPEGPPAIKLLDFGIAKLIKPESLEITALETRTGAGPMTPLFAAPEQFAGEALTTASDVYSLGVLFYLMLTGSTPYEQRGSAADFERQVRAGTPRRLSKIVTQHTTSENSKNTVSQRNTTRDRLRHRLEGDLERIGALALHNDPTRRYASAGQLGEDIARCQRGEAVWAQDDTWRYRLHVLVRRNRVAVGAAAGTLLTLSILSVFLAIQTGRARTALSEATAQTARSARVVQALVGLFDTADPRTGAVGDQIPVSAFLGRVEAAVDSLAEDPALQTELLEILGQIHAGRDEGQQALVFLRRAAAATRSAGNDEAHQLRLDHAVAKATNTIDSERGTELLRESVAQHITMFGSQSPQAALAVVDLATALEPKEALPLLDSAVENLEASLGPDSVEVARALYRRSKHRSWAGMVTGAREDSQRSLGLFQQAVGPDHPETLRALHAYSTTIPREQSLAVLRDLIGRQERVFGRDSTPVALSLNTVGEHLSRMGQVDEALDAFSRSVTILRKLHGQTSPLASNPARNQAMLTGLLGRYKDAAGLFEQLKASVPADERSQAYIDIQAAYMKGRAGGAEELVASIALAERQIATLDRIQVGESDIYPSRARSLQVKLLLAAQQFQRALRVADLALEDARQRIAEEHQITIELAFLHARAQHAVDTSTDAQLLLQLERFEALPLHERAEAALARRQLAAH